MHLLRSVLKQFTYMCHYGVFISFAVGNDKKLRTGRAGFWQLAPSVNYASLRVICLRLPDEKFISLKIDMLPTGVCVYL